MPESCSAGQTADWKMGTEISHTRDAVMSDAGLTSDAEPWQRPGKRLSIALISDFSYPRMGGVEMHQYYLAQVRSPMRFRGFAYDFRG